MMVSAPATAAMHDRFPEAIEEEVEVLDLDFAGLRAGMARPGAGLARLLPRPRPEPATTRT